MSTSVETGQLLRTALYDYHVSHGGKMVEYAGWEMPLHYGSILEEHNQVRRSGGMFDVSHMGRLRFGGKDARKFLDHVCTRQIVDMTPGAVRYSIVCNPAGGCHDDVLVYKLGEHDFYMVCNAANRLKLVKHFNDVKSERGFVFKMEDETQSTAMIAIQGPKVMGLMGGFSREVAALKRYRFVEKNLILAKVMISRTGYTGEDGVEVILPARFVNKALDMMLGQNEAMETIKPTGLGARDSLRLEASMALYGHEIDEERDPWSAGVQFAIKLDKGVEHPEAGRFIGQDALENIAKNGTRQKLAGLELEGKRSARQGMKVMIGGKDAGVVTSGCLSPTLGKAIAMAYVEPAHTAVGTAVQIDLGKVTAEAKVVPMPFYKAPPST
ncbi:MAG TPA: glycine cleavage system aminomethyltransferase GcvT [Phycisphaerales bacterium]|nr:glycine cleavage system aminomethyltransferase GcvT [Phycisphaerales bacterium]